MEQVRFLGAEGGRAMNGVDKLVQKKLMKADNVVAGKIEDR